MQTPFPGQLPESVLVSNKMMEALFPIGAPRISQNEVL